jgi:hypothetical protein
MPRWDATPHDAGSLAPTQPHPDRQHRSRWRPARAARYPDIRLRICRLGGSAPRVRAIGGRPARAHHHAHGGAHLTSPIGPPMFSSNRRPAKTNPIAASGRRFSPTRFWLTGAAFTISRPPPRLCAAPPSQKRSSFWAIPPAAGTASAGEIGSPVARVFHCNGQFGRGRSIIGPSDPDTLTRPPTFARSRPCAASP